MVKMFPCQAPPFPLVHRSHKRVIDRMRCRKGRKSFQAVEEPLAYGIYLRFPFTSRLTIFPGERILPLSHGMRLSERNRPSRVRRNGIDTGST